MTEEKQWEVERRDIRIEVLLQKNTDLLVENARLRRELELYKAFSPDVSHILVDSEIEKMGR